MEIDLAISSYRFTDPKLEELPLHREEYFLVGAPGLLKSTPLRLPAQAAQHTLLDATADLPLFRYVREASPEGASMRFGRIVRLGTLDAIRARVIDGAGVAVLPSYFVARDLEQRRLRRAMPALPVGHDHFRLLFRRDDPRRAVYERLASSLRRFPLC